MDAALDRVSVTMHGLASSPNAGSKFKLGPSLTSRVKVEGIPVETLLDTGAPVTIDRIAGFHSEDTGGTETRGANHR